MAEPLPKQALESAGDPNMVLQQTFDLERRGFDQRQVQSYLRAIAESLKDAQNREAEMRSRLGKAIRRAEAAEQSLRQVPSEDPSELTRQIGDEVTSVLDAAHAAGEQRVAAAEKSAERLMANAKGEATQIRGAAETIMEERRSEADAAAGEIIAQGNNDADALREQARADAEAMKADAASRVAQARDDCDLMIHEAEEARAQILEDMERRRRQARAQVERLRVGRDRLLRSYEVVRRTLDESTVELKLSLQEAKVRGDTAARLVAAEPLAGRDQLESELAAAKMIGTVRVTDPKVLRSPALPRQIDPPQVPNIDLRTESAPTPRKPKVDEAKKKMPEPPRPPAMAPNLKATPTHEQDPPAATAASVVDEQDAAITEAVAPEPLAIDSEPDEVEASAVDAEPAQDLAEPTEATEVDEPAEADVPIDAELAALEDENLDVVEPADEIEEVVALAAADSAPDKPASPSLFAALREQSDDPAGESVTTPAAQDAQPATEEQPEQDQPATQLVSADLEAQRDAIITDAAAQLERRLKRALADEQNDLLAGIRAAKKDVELTSLVGDPDAHLMRYVVAINEVAFVTYGAGAALVDAQAEDGCLPAGAVEELLASDVVGPIRERLESLDLLGVESADLHVDPVRAFYRQRKTDHLGLAASRLAQLLCVSGVCDALPSGAALPWATPK